MDRGDLRDAAVDGSACAIYLRSGLRLKGLSRSQQWQPLRSISTHIIASPWGNRASVAPGAHANRVVFTLQVMFFRSIPVVPPHKCILYCVLMCVIVCSCCRESQSSKIRHSSSQTTIIGFLRVGLLSFCTAINCITVLCLLQRSTLYYRFYTQISQRVYLCAANPLKVNTTDFLFFCHFKCLF